MTTANTPAKGTAASRKPATAKAKASKSRSAINAKALARAVASANKRLPGITLDKARKGYAEAANREHGSCAVYALALNQRWGKVLSEHKLHWSEVWQSKNARADGSNLQPLWKAIDAERKDLEELLKGKHSNPAQVWKRARDKAFEIANPGRKRERDHVVPAERARKSLIAVYKSLMSETAPTALDLQVSEAVGELLRTAFKVDLSTLNV